MEDKIKKILEDHNLTIDLLTNEEIESLKREIAIREAGGSFLDGVLSNPDLYYGRPVKQAVIKKALAEYGLTIEHFSIDEIDLLRNEIKVNNEDRYYLDIDSLIQKGNSPLCEKIKRLRK